MNNNIKITKFIIVTWGVLSGLGKWIISASIAKLLNDSKKIVTIKCDWYLNVDPWTMNPYEHWEVFVQDDGGEVDLDFWHYERFLNINSKFCWNLTSGKIFKDVIDKERKGDYLWKTVQMIPHVTNYIKDNFYNIVKEEDADIVIIEMWGTVWDIEMMLFNETARQLKLDLWSNNIIYVHLTYVPELDFAWGEQKTKPTQQWIEILRRIGIQPDIIIWRSQKVLEEDTKEKISLFSNVKKDNVISDPNLTTVYELPIIFEREWLMEILKKELDIDYSSDLKKWIELVEKIKNPEKIITIAICGKYAKLQDSYISITEALKHAWAHLNTWIKIKLIETTKIEKGKIKIEDLLKWIDGVIIPWGFWIRGTEGKIQIIEYIRKNKIPFLGICLGLQLAVIEYARNVCNINNANSTEFDTSTIDPVIDLLSCQVNVSKKWWTMRLWWQDVKIKKWTQAYDLFNLDLVRRRFRHRYEVNDKYISLLENKWLIFSGSTPDNKIMQILEIKDHPFFMSCQFHPELTSRLEQPDEMFYEFVKTCFKLK